MSESRFSAGIDEYALRMSQRYGLSPDETFIRAYEEVSARHNAEVQEGGVILQCHRFEDDLPGTIGSGTPDRGQINWYHTLSTRTELPVSIGGTVDTDVIVLTALSKSISAIAPKGEARDNYRTAARQLSRRAAPSDKSELFGIHGTKVSSGFTNKKYTFNPEDLRPHVTKPILDSPNVLHVAVAAKARLPDAPMEIIPKSEYTIPIGIIDYSVCNLEPTPRTINDIRLQLSQAGALASELNIEAYYSHIFGYDSPNAEVWTSKLKEPVYDLAAYRQQHKEVAEIFSQLHTGNRLTQLPQDTPPALLRLFT